MCDTEQITVTPEEYEWILELINNPPEPSETLKEAMKEYMEKTK